MLVIKYKNKDGYSCISIPSKYGNINFIEVFGNVPWYLALLPSIRKPNVMEYHSSSTWAIESSFTILAGSLVALRA